jgi:ABC-type branched-subunit amino acid transport system ATPase component
LVARLRRPKQTAARAPGQDTAALSVRGLHVSYGRVPICFGIDLDVEERSVCALLGTNGSGKSTILRAVSGVVPFRRGTVRLFGEDITGLSAEQRVRHGLVMIPGGRATFPSLTVEESLRIGTWPFRHDRRRVETAVAEAVARFPLLAERRHQRAGTLSGGEQQLLALARALMTRPRLLLIDELTLGLAPKAADEILGAVTDLVAEGQTVLLVEQSVRRAVAVAERAYFLDRGEVRFCGPASELLKRTDLLRPVLLAAAGGGDTKSS